MQGNNRQRPTETNRPIPEAMRRANGMPASGANASRKQTPNRPIPEAMRRANGMPASGANASRKQTPNRPIPEAMRRANNAAAAKQNAARSAPARRPAPAAQNTPDSRICTDRTAEYARLRAEAERKKMREAQLKRQKEHEKQVRQKKRKQFWDMTVSRLILFLIIFAVLASVSVLLFWIHFNKTNEEPLPKTVRYSYGGAEGEALPGETAFQNGVLYVDFTAAAEYLGLSRIGSTDSMRFVIPQDTTADSAGNGREEEVIFYKGSDLALVNGQNVRMEGKAAVLTAEGPSEGQSEGHYLIPASFITEYMRGVQITFEDNQLDIARTFTRDEADKLEFILKSESTHDPIPENWEEDPPVTDPPVTDPPEPDITVTFRSDLSKYEEYMNPKDRDAYLLLVNSTSKLDKNYVPADLTDLVDTRKDGQRATQQMIKPAAMALEALFIEMRACGYTDVSVTSAYRTYNKQSSLFNMYTNQEMAANPSLTRAQAEAIVVTYSSRPGTSEHQAGLCCDMHNLPSALDAFAKEEVFLWLKDNAWKFGFILRYPEGKQPITGVKFEPWHYRYVGRYHAKAIYDSGLCLEEYLEKLNS